LKEQFKDQQSPKKPLSNDFSFSGLYFNGVKLHVITLCRS